MLGVFSFNLSRGSDDFGAQAGASFLYLPVGGFDKANHSYIYRHIWWSPCKLVSPPPKLPSKRRPLRSTGGGLSRQSSERLPRYDSSSKCSSNFALRDKQLDEIGCYLPIPIIMTICITPLSAICEMQTYLSVPQGRSCTQESPVDSNHGVLSSIVTDDTGCGSLTSPWSIKMATGQRVSIRFTDFGWSGNSGDTRCTPYAYIVEKSVGVNQTICGDSERERHVYTSTSDHVLIQIVPQDLRGAQFMLWFDGVYHKFTFSALKLTFAPPYQTQKISTLM